METPNNEQVIKQTDMNSQTLKETFNPYDFPILPSNPTIPLDLHPYTSSLSEGYVSSDDDAQSLPSQNSRNSSQTRKERKNARLFGRERTSFSQELLKWPLLVCIAIFIYVDLMIYMVVSSIVKLYEYLFVWRGKRLQLLKRLINSKSYPQYRSAAVDLDNYFGNNLWKEDPASETYNWRLVKKIVKKLKACRVHFGMKIQDQKRKILSTKELLLHGACNPNMGGVEHENLYSQTYYGTKEIVEEYVSELENAITTLSETPFLDREEKYQLFKWISLNYGKTALCLSGGATLGYSHLGVIKTLLEENMLPKIITGTSCGSLMAAIVCVRTEEELRREILVPEIRSYLKACSEPWTIRLNRLLSENQLFSFEDWYTKVLDILKGPDHDGNITFMEAYKRTGRILNISVVPDEPYAYSKQLNYVTAPDVVIATATIASSAIPGVLHPIQLLMKTESGELVPYKGAGKRWRDGSLRSDISQNELKQLWNVNFAIVSQVNPHIVPFFFFSRGMPGSPSAHRHGKGWRGGFLASSLVHHFRLDLQKWLRFVREMDLMPRIMGSDVSSIWLQTFHGACTILPRIAMNDYAWILDDPRTDSQMEHYLEAGVRGTWPSLHMIENRLRIERSIANSLRNSKNQVGQNFNTQRLSQSQSISPNLNFDTREGKNLPNSDSIDQQNNTQLRRSQGDASVGLAIRTELQIYPNLKDRLREISSHSAIEFDDIDSPYHNLS
ncbi:hypothetical protein HK098_006712 [Nowakowskiella sp. JEL0407]|nr:hypothetical protein HK098_006712 [Nowakowskiella sp. JEL0407]